MNILVLCSNSNSCFKILIGVKKFEATAMYNSLANIIFNGVPICMKKRIEIANNLHLILSILANMFY